MLSGSDVGVHSIPLNDNVAINPFETEQRSDSWFSLLRRKKQYPKGWTRGAPVANSVLLLRKQKSMILFYSTLHFKAYLGFQLRSISSPFL